VITALHHQQDIFRMGGLKKRMPAVYWPFLAGVLCLAGFPGSGGFFSAGVMRTAFDEADRTATPRQADRLNPDAVRFAVPITAMELGNSDLYNPDRIVVPTFSQNPLSGRQRQSRPSALRRLPWRGTPSGQSRSNANDNVTALQ
jgi:hypothetical protein